MTPQTMTFAISREKLESSRAKLAESGIKLAGDAGNLEMKGFAGGYQFDEAASQLKVTLTKKPMFITMSMVLKKVREKMKEEGIVEA